MRLVLARRVLTIAIALTLPLTVTAKPSSSNPHIHYAASAPYQQPCHGNCPQYIKVDQCYGIPRPCKHCTPRFLGLSKGEIVAIAAAAAVVITFIIIGNAKDRSPRRVTTP